MPPVINPDGSRVLIEAVFYRHGVVIAEACDTLDEATQFLEDGEEWGTLASVGVFVDHEPVRHRDTDLPPTALEADHMRADYAKAGTG